jgi:hypothetical protein
MAGWVIKINRERSMPSQNQNLLIRIVLSLVAAAISYTVGASLTGPGPGIISALIAVAVVNYTILTPKLLKQINDAWSDK